MIAKTELHAYCLQLLQDKCLYIQQSITDAQAASNNDTKSSMGDKYETTREMMQIEINKLGQQLYDMQQMLLALKVLDPNKVYEFAEPGAILITEKMNFYLAAGIGKVQIKDDLFMVVSPSSPIGKQMMHVKSGEVFSVNGAKYKVTDLY